MPKRLIAKFTIDCVYISRQSTYFIVFDRQERNKRSKGAQCLGCPITGGRRKVPTTSEVLSSLQYIYSQKNLSSNMGAPSNLGTPLADRDVNIFSSGCYKNILKPSVKLKLTSMACTYD